MKFYGDYATRKAIIAYLDRSADEAEQAAATCAKEAELVPGYFTYRRADYWKAAASGLRWAKEICERKPAGFVDGDADRS